MNLGWPDWLLAIGVSLVMCCQVKYYVILCACASMHAAAQNQLALSFVFSYLTILQHFFPYADTMNLCPEIM